MSTRHYGAYNDTTHVILGYNKESNMFLVLDPNNLQETSAQELGRILQEDFAVSKFNLSEVLTREPHPNGGNWFHYCVSHASQVPARLVTLFDKEQSQYWMGDPTNYEDPSYSRTKYVLPEQNTSIPSQFLEEVVENSKPLVETPKQAPVTTDNTKVIELESKVGRLENNIKALTTSIKSLTRELKKAGVEADVDLPKK